MPFYLVGKAGPRGSVVQMEPQTDLERDVASLFVKSLNLSLSPPEIDPLAPLFGEGLGLDSIDMLEIALAVSKRYGVELRSEDKQAFSSLRALTTYIEQHRAR
jgi:acyl carrier protein